MKPSDEVTRFLVQVRRSFSPRHPFRVAVEALGPTPGPDDVWKSLRILLAMLEFDEAQ